MENHVFEPRNYAATPVSRACLLVFFLSNIWAQPSSLLSEVSTLLSICLGEVVEVPVADPGVVGDAEVADGVLFRKGLF